MKIILNKCFGGFDVSPQGYELYAKKKGFELYKYKDNLDFRNREYIKLKDEENKLFKYYFTKDFGEIAKISDEDYEKYNLYLREEYRQDQTLIEVVEELGEKAKWIRSLAPAVIFIEKEEYAPSFFFGNIKLKVYFY